MNNEYVRRFVYMNRSAVRLMKAGMYVFKILFWIVLQEKC